MDPKTWLLKHNPSLQGKTVAITGASGDLGREICRAVLTLSGSLVLLNRDPEKTRRLTEALLAEFPDGQIRFLPLELTDLASVDRAAGLLAQEPPDILVHNAGAYKIPRCTCATGLDNVFQINFFSPYYLTKRLLPALSARGSKVVVMGSVAYAYSASDPADVDFSGRGPCHLVYGNSKRYLMFAFAQLLADWPRVDFAVAHPGVSFTNISNHYPKALYALIRWPMQVFLPKPEKAVRSMVYALTHPVPRDCWVGPGFFRVWGEPRVRPLRGCPDWEKLDLHSRAESLYNLVAYGQHNK